MYLIAMHRMLLKQVPAQDTAAKPVRSSQHETSTRYQIGRRAPRWLGHVRRKVMEERDSFGSVPRRRVPIGGNVVLEPEKPRSDALNFLEVFLDDIR